MLCTAKMTLKWGYLLKIKAWEKIINHHIVEGTRASLVVDCKSWALGWDSLVPSTVW